MKRAFDLVMGTVLGVVTFPVVLVLGLVSVVTLREWPLFVQDRIGQAGEMFRFVKIRSMPSRRIGKYSLKGEWSEEDLPVIMRQMRRLHLDELPQLWLVMIGKMSLVGPRPRMPDEFEPVPPEYHQARVQVPQGCTCLWQIGAHTDGLPSDSPQYDYWYLQHGGLRLDLWILVQTALQMVGLTGPKTIHDTPRAFQSRGWRRLGVDIFYQEALRGHVSELTQPSTAAPSDDELVHSTAA